MFILDGVCHIFVDKDANLELSKKVLLDAKTDYPAACNAVVIFPLFLWFSSFFHFPTWFSLLFVHNFSPVFFFKKETILVHEALHKSGQLADILETLQTNGIFIVYFGLLFFPWAEAKELIFVLFEDQIINVFIFSGVTVNGGPLAAKELNLPLAPVLHHEYGSNDCTLEIVPDVKAAIDFIHQNGRYHYLSYIWIIAFIWSNFFNFSFCLGPSSAHTDSILTENSETAEFFLRSVDRSVFQLFSSLN